jgi:DNA-binding transcriptional LysR family regulator
MIVLLQKTNDIVTERIVAQKRLESRSEGSYASENRKHGAGMADGIGDIELFCAVAEAGGISAGARQLESSPPAVSRGFSALEARLGVRLAERSARRFRLTDEGKLYYKHCQGIVRELRDAEAEVSARGETARGLLKVGAPMEFGRRRVAPLLAQFAAKHPELEVHLVLSDAGLEIGQDGLDVALRVDRPDDQAIITRKLASARRVLCAAPSYLAARETPNSPVDLASHECLRLARRHRLHDRWRFHTENGVEEIKVTGHLSSSSGDVLHGWALQGHGLSLEALWDVTEDLRSGHLIECLADCRWENIELFATFLPGQPVPPRIRLFVDFMVSMLVS